jgi:hypothetical protein
MDHFYLSKVPYNGKVNFPSKSEQSEKHKEQFVKHLASLVNKLGQQTLNREEKVT